MLVDLVFGSKISFRILSVLTESPGQGITKEDIKKITKVGGNSLFKSINMLLKNDVITSKKIGKRTYYKINMTNKYSRLIVDLMNIERRDFNNINPSIITIFREYTRQVIDAINPLSIYVFGSIVKNSYREDSDVDIAIIAAKELGTKERVELEKINEKIKDRFGREIQPHLFTEKEFKSKDRLVEQIHRDGIKLL